MRSCEQTLEGRSNAVLGGILGIQTGLWLLQTRLLQLCLQKQKGLTGVYTKQKQL